MYYALTDDTYFNELIHTGLNDTSENELLASLLAFASNDTDITDEDLKTIKQMSLNELAELWQFTVVKQRTKFKKL